MLNECIVTRADASVASEIATINIFGWQKAYRGIIPNQILDSMNLKRLTEKWRLCINSNSEVLIISVENKIIGFSRVERELTGSTTGEIAAIYLHPDFWFKGFGKLLCSASFELLKSIGCENVVVWVLKDNIRAKSFYEKMKFVSMNQSRIKKISEECELIEDGYMALL